LQNKATDESRNENRPIVPATVAGNVHSLFRPVASLFESSMRKIKLLK